MILRLSFYFILFQLISTSLGAQTSYTLLEGTTEFEGMKKSKEPFLRDQIFQYQGNDFQIKIIEYNVQLLKNIPGIKQTVYRLDTIENKINITYSIEELNTLTPIINLGGIRDNVWFRLGLTDFNWLGRGHFFSAIYQNNNGLHSGEVYLKIPRKHKSVWGYAASISSWMSEEPLFFSEATVDYNYNNNSLGLTAIRHFGQNTTVEFGGTAFVEIYKKVIDNPEIESPGPLELTQNKFLSKIAINRDFLNYDYFYRNGYKWNLTYQNVFTFDEDVNFNSLLLRSFVYFRPSKKINIAIRAKFGLSSNSNSPFAPFVADSHINIRGIGNRISRGTAEAVFNIEYRHTTSDHETWASQFVLFSDIGSWRNPGGELKEIFNKNQFRHFVGIGGRAIYKKLFGATIRVDYGMDIYNPKYHGFVLGLGQYF